MKFNVKYIILLLNSIVYINGNYINAMEIEEKTFIVDNKLRDRIQDVTDILRNKFSKIDDDSPEIQDITENLSSLRGLLNHNKLTEAQMILFESIEKSVNNKNTKSINNKIKMPFSNNEVKNNINIINNKTHNKNGINNNNITDCNKNEILINKKITINNNIIINNIENDTNYAPITHNKNFIYDGNNIINKDFKLLYDFTDTLRTLAKNYANDSEYITDIAIAIESTKNNWGKTILPCSKEQENDLKILQLMYPELESLFVNLLEDEDFTSTLINNMCNNELLTSEIYYCILRRLNADMFNSKDFPSNMITNVIKNIKRNTTKTPKTYKLILQWFLYCSIDKLISLFPQEISNISNDNKMMEFINSYVLNPNYEVINKNFDTQQKNYYNRYVKVTNIILDYIIQLFSEEAIIESSGARSKLLLNNLKEKLNPGNTILDLFFSIKNNMNNNTLGSNYIKQVLKNDKTIKYTLSHFKNNGNIDLKNLLVSKIYNVKKLIVKHSYDILFNKYKVIQYNKNNEIKMKTYINSNNQSEFNNFWKKNYMKFTSEQPFTIFEIPKKFHNAFDNLLYDNCYTITLCSTLVSDWKKVIKKNDFNNVIMFGIHSDSQHEAQMKFGIKSQYILNYILFLSNTIKEDEVQDIQLRLNPVQITI